MPKNRVCATATGLPKFTRRAFVRATAAVPLAAAPVVAMAGTQDDQLEIDAYARGFEDGQRRMMEVLMNQVEMDAAHPESPVKKIKRLSSEMVTALDNHTSEFGDTEWQLSMSRTDATGALSAAVLFVGYQGQAGNRTKVSELIWDLGV